MAIELAKHISAQLDSLPKEHPDRNFLRGILVTVDAFNNKPGTELQPHDTETASFSKQEEREFILSLKSSGLPARAQTGIRKRFYSGKIKDLSELREIPDFELIRWGSIGPKSLGEIRKIFPFNTIKLPA